MELLILRTDKHLFCITLVITLELMNVYVIKKLWNKYEKFPVVLPSVDFIFRYKNGLL